MLLNCCGSEGSFSCPACEGVPRHEVDALACQRLTQMRAREEQPLALSRVGEGVDREQLVVHVAGVADQLGDAIGQCVQERVQRAWRARRAQSP